MMDKYFTVGDTIYGFCEGAFGRDDYDSKICVMVSSKYAVFQYLNGGEFEGQATVLNYNSYMVNYNLDKWKEEEY